MAPRGRSRKRRLTRMDAAIDHMSEIGFSKDVVRRTAKALLKEYGGDDGWTFIEENAYRLLIETILEEQEKLGRNENALDKCVKEEIIPKDDSLLEYEAGVHAIAAAAGPSGGLAPTCSEVMDTVAQIAERGDAKGWKISGFDQNCNEKRAVNVNSIVAVKVKDEISGLDQDWNEKRAVNVKSIVAVKVKDEMPLDNTPICSPPPVIPTPSPVNTRPAGKRKPCYGWISSDDEADDDFIQLTAHPEYL